jgi:hypothetical protein
MEDWGKLDVADSLKKGELLPQHCAYSKNSPSSSVFSLFRWGISHSRFSSSPSSLCSSTVPVFLLTLNNAISSENLLHLLIFQPVGVSQSPLIPVNLSMIIHRMNTAKPKC